ncbi:hypothetical protein NT05HA_1931 [Aggregatibacter aphrophilus NJ8700]|nr:hypothetical protein NT05HA_1931 [Aggregatibacter aphrophilus NJ8700]
MMKGIRQREFLAAKCGVFLLCFCMVNICLGLSAINGIFSAFC